MSFAGIVMKEYYHDDNHHLQQQQTLRAVCWLYFSSSPSWWWSSRLWELSGLVCWRPTGIHLSRLISSNLDTLLLQSDHHHHHCQSFHWKNVFKAQCHTRPKNYFDALPPCQTWRSRCAQLWSCHSLLLEQGAELLILLEMMLIILILILIHNCNAHTDTIWLWIYGDRILWWHLM